MSACEPDAAASVTDTVADTVADTAADASSGPAPEACVGKGTCAAPGTVECGTDSTALVCTSNEPCQVAGSCNPLTGLCRAPAAAVEGTPCNDGDLCTTNESCRKGLCVGPAALCPPTGPCATDACETACDDGDPCTANESCEAGTCKGGTPACP